jgi:hypothetical protein
VIQNGLSPYSGGGLSNSGTLVLNESLVQNNTCACTANGNADGGGGIGNFGTLTINNSTITGNSSSFHGGGLFNYNGTLTLNNSTVSGNSAMDGGGLFSFSTVRLNNTTITGNNSMSGGGIKFYNDYIGNFAFTIKNSLVAGNTSTGTGLDCSGPISSAGYNLIGNNSDCAFAAITGDLVGTGANPINARLNPLQDNGGLTFTHALGTGSPAIDAGNPAAPGSGANACLATDQRGISRPVGAHCDMGAYEGSAAPTSTALVSTYTAGNSIPLPVHLFAARLIQTVRRVIPTPGSP